jgi:hypothetical protein
MCRVGDYLHGLEFGSTMFVYISLKCLVTTKSIAIASGKFTSIEQHVQHFFSAIGDLILWKMVCRSVHNMQGVCLLCSRNLYFENYMFIS